MGDGDGADDRTQHGVLAERIALFAIGVGVALLVTGIGFLVLTIGGALRAPAAPISPTA